MSTVIKYIDRYCDWYTNRDVSYKDVPKYLVSNIYSKLPPGVPPIFGCSLLLFYLATLPIPHSSVRMVGKPLVGLPRNRGAKKSVFF